MEHTYKLVNGAGGQPICVNRSDGWSIPLDPANGMYQAYLVWLEEGNTPEPADDPQQ